ncbi:MAG: hypothetical protein PF508_09545 [Spirochaeta sp.]|nr:hypothetical protein [Spirochaeta sp.]
MVHLNCRPAGTGDIYDSANCLALLSIPIVQTEETITLEGNSGTFAPNGSVWMGDPGWGKYDLYILIDVNGTGDLEEGVGDRTNDYPSTVFIDGDTTITLDYFNDLIER